MALIGACLIPSTTLLHSRPKIIFRQDIFKDYHPYAACGAPDASDRVSLSHLGVSRHSTVSTMGMDDSDDEEQVAVGMKVHSEMRPKHIAVIMDGHKRWAEERGLPIEQGHHAGFANLGDLILTASSKFQIKLFTVYAFSNDNWGRSKKEIDFLMRIIEDFIQSHVMELILCHGLQFTVIGDKLRLPASLQTAISQAKESSRSNKGMHFVMAMSYSGHLDITEACKKIAWKVANGVFGAKDINENVLEQHLMTSCVEGYSYPDLLTRTSGELRVSNFLLWQLAYTEFYFANKMFPDFDEADFVEALSSFQGRKRNYGGRPQGNKDQLS